MAGRKFRDELTEPLKALVREFNFLPDEPEAFLISERKRGQGGDYEAAILILTPTDLVRYTVRPRKPLSDDLYVDTELFPLRDIGRIESTNRSGDDEHSVELGRPAILLPLKLDRSDARNSSRNATMFLETLVRLVREARVFG
ncbi:MAG: hypothetical protein M3290_12860 [Actinomycetota bacterium]|nr:hypothetical protein [Actinomycetota bacterium]